MSLEVRSEQVPSSCHILGCKLPAVPICHSHALLPVSTSASHSKPEPQNCHVYSSRELGTVWSTVWHTFLVNSEVLLVRCLGGWVLCSPLPGLASGGLWFAERQ